MLGCPAADNLPMQHRHERIALETPRHRITGTVTLARDGYRSRLSDLLNAPERAFLPLTDVTIEPLDGEGEGTRHEFMALGCQHIVFALPLGPVEPDGPSSVGPPAPTAAG